MTDNGLTRKIGHEGAYAAGLTTARGILAIGADQRSPADEMAGEEGRMAEHRNSGLGHVR
jgi:hypothetical protein